MVVDLGITVQGETEDELPEVILCQARFDHVDLESATLVSSEQRSPFQLEQQIFIFFFSCSLSLAHSPLFYTFGGIGLPLQLRCRSLDTTVLRFRIVVESVYDNVQMITHSTCLYLRSNSIYSTQLITESMLTWPMPKLHDSIKSASKLTQSNNILNVCVLMRQREMRQPLNTSIYQFNCFFFSSLPLHIIIGTQLYEGESLLVLFEK